MLLRGKRARTQTAQETFSELFSGDERLWSRLFGSIQGDSHVTKGGDAIVLGTACEAHGEEMALTLSPRECERSLAAPVTYVLSIYKKTKKTKQIYIFYLSMVVLLHVSGLGSVF